MNLKLEALKACIFMLTGAFLCSRFMPKQQEPAPPIIKQEQASKCIANINKHTNLDGSSDVSLSFEADSSQAHEIKPPAPPKEENYLSGGLYADNRLNHGVSFGLKINSWDYSAESDLIKDHRISARKILITW